MGVPVPTPITEPFGSAAGVGFINNPIPVPSQIGIVAGAASFTDGFPPQNFVPTEDGGTPPSGADFNGLLYMITAYCAMLQAGQYVAYDADTSTAITGYAEGAVLMSVADPLAYWTAAAGGQTVDPDSELPTGSTGWLSSKALFESFLPSAGTVNDFNPSGPSDYFMDFDTTAGNLTITGFVPLRDGQTLYISNIGANTLTLAALNAGSAATHRIRAIGDFAIAQNGTLTIKYSTEIGKWLLV